MKTYLLTLTGAILLSAIVSILISDGKMGRFVKGMTRLFVFSIVIVPLVSLFGKKSFDFSTGNIGTDENYLLKCAALLSEKDEEIITNYLFEEYSLVAETIVERSASGKFACKKITVKINDFGIFGQDEHIDMINRIKTDIEEKYGCQTEVIWQGR